MVCTPNVVNTVKNIFLISTYRIDYYDSYPLYADRYIITEYKIKQFFV